ncbi:MAG: MBL fold metallo-hydrolase [Clostridia bacterium]|nr:MBL fold metallo-hydrolase [Clostridia bacterium]
MEKQLKVTYHYNSGFSIRIGGMLLIFDYWEGEGQSLPEVGRLTRKILSAYEQIYVFVSHSHPDHFSSVIYNWREGLPTTYVVSSDMPVGTRGKRIVPLETMDLGPDISVKAFGSTDLGVSFLVRAYGMDIFHAGDLNLWHWRQESSLREIEAAETAFYQACAPLKGEKIDLALFPVDPRQGMMYDAGANHFILTQKPRVFIPMHWQDREEVAVDFARRAKSPQTEVLALVRPGEAATISYRDHHLNIHIIEPPKDMADLPISPMRRPERRPMEAQGDDPFVDTDLPVELE